MIIEVADHKPILRASEDGGGIIMKEDKKRSLMSEICGSNNKKTSLISKVSIRFTFSGSVASTRISPLQAETYSPVGYQFFPERLTGTIGKGLSGNIIRVVSRRCKIERRFFLCKPMEKNISFGKRKSDFLIKIINYLYISSFNPFTLSSARYSSNSISRSIIPFGVNSIIRLATVCIKVWSWLVNKTMPL